MTVEIRNPANPDEVVGSFPTLTAGDVPGVIEAARKAQRKWAKVPQPERGRIVDNLSLIHI